MEFFVISLLNGVSYGLLLFMLSSGLTLIFSMMGVLNFAHASVLHGGRLRRVRARAQDRFLSGTDPCAAGGRPLGALVERYGLRTVHRYGHVAELLFTFGLAYLVEELVKVVWGLTAVPYRVPEFSTAPCSPSTRPSSPKCAAS